ncbi:unnamed protein product [Thelazia callipaeda]|uniref:PAP-associated domain-containing protein n=1 Tax=Thelazia callipaeda TaxID=103827 RepID=A0A0N5CVL9_THECL|nr:unnamed protein product [Thelazia callipaeda]
MLASYSLAFPQCTVMENTVNETDANESCDLEEEKSLCDDECSMIADSEIICIDSSSESSENENFESGDFDDEKAITNGVNYENSTGSSDVACMHSSGENFTSDPVRGVEFWQLMRNCAQQKIKVLLYSYHGQNFCALGNALLHRKAETNLKKPSDDIGYYDVDCVVLLCSCIKNSFEKYKEELFRGRFRRRRAVDASTFHEMKPYLLGETDIQPSVIDPHGPIPTFKIVSSVKDEPGQKNNTFLTDWPTNSTYESMVVDGIEAEFFCKSCYMEFLLDWLVCTNLECIKNTSVLKLTEEQKIQLNAKNENCHYVFMKINDLPTTHFYGAGFGLDQIQAFWAASRSIVRRLYHAGFVTPVLYHTIGKSGRPKLPIKMKRWRRIKEWRHVKNAVELFMKEMAKRIPHWVKLTNNGYNNEEFVRAINEVIEMVRVTAERQESKVNEYIRRKRKAEDELETSMLRLKRNRIFTQMEDPMKSKFEDSSRKATNSSSWSAADANTEMLQNGASVSRNVRFGDDSDETSDDDEDCPCVKVRIESPLSSLPVTSMSFGYSDPKCQAFRSVLGVSCVEDALAIRIVIKEKKTMFVNEFKSFDEHIWKHFLVNAQDDRTFSWKMVVRQKLLALIRQIYRDANLIAVGSTVNGCGSYNSDMDLCLCQPQANPAVNAHSFAIGVLKKLYKKFVMNWREMFKRCNYIPAKVPIIKLEMAAPYEELEIDINCNNIAGIYNSHLLHYYSRIDDRFPAICLLVKHWAINAGINNPMTGTLNSYSLILMVLHFLQCGSLPPVLPNLQFLYPNLFNATCSVDDLELFRELPYPLPTREINTETVGELLLAFFDYYARFDFKNKAISIRNGCIYSRTNLPGNTVRFKIFIEEPYDQKNTARCVTSIDNLNLIRKAFIAARDAFLLIRSGPPNLEYINVH